jgi:hypothetical protein
MLAYALAVLLVTEIVLFVLMASDSGFPGSNRIFGGATLGSSVLILLLFVLQIREGLRQSKEQPARDSDKASVDQ